MQRISYRSCHLRLTSHGCDLTIGRHMTFRNLFYCFVDPFGWTVCDQIITFGDHPADLLFWDRSVQNDRVPVFLVQMIAGSYRIIGRAPEIPPFRRNLHVQIDKAVALIDPEKCFFTSTNPDKLPVGIVKRFFFVNIVKRQTVSQCFFSCCHSICSPSVFIRYQKQDDWSF